MTGPPVSLPVFDSMSESPGMWALSAFRNLPIFWRWAAIRIVCPVSCVASAASSSRSACENKSSAAFYPEVHASAPNVKSGSAAFFGTGLANITARPGATYYLK